MVVASLWVDFVACVGWCLLLFWFTSFAGLLRDGVGCGMHSFGFGLLAVG